MGHRDSTENDVNVSGSSAKTDTPVTRGRSGPVRYVTVRRADGQPWGPFASMGEAIAWAERKWPGVPQMQDGLDPDECWDIEDLWAPG